MEKEVLLSKKILEEVKKYSKIHNIKVIEIILPKKYGFNKKKLKLIFNSIGINIKSKEGDKLKIISIEERY